MQRPYDRRQHSTYDILVKTMRLEQARGAWSVGRPVRGVGPAAGVGALCYSPGQWEVEKSSCAIQITGAGVGAGSEQVP